MIKVLEGTIGLVLSAVLVAIGFITAIIMGTLAGTLMGWIVGYFFPATLDIVSYRIFSQILPHWQLGAALGFVGGFFRTRVNTEKAKDKK